MRPLGPVHNTLAGNHGAQRHPGGDALGGADDIRLNAKVFDRPPFARAANTRLDFIGDQQDAIFVAQLAQGREESGRWNDITTFPLDRFHQNAGYFLARDNLAEDFFFDIADDRFAIIFTGQDDQHGPVRIGEGCMDNPIHQGAKTFVVAGFAGSECDSAHGAPMKTAQEANKLAAPGVNTGPV